MLGEIAAVATAAGIGVAILQLRQAQRQRILDFEARFMERYWQLMDELPPECIVHGVPVPDTESGRRAFAAYLRLCEDECEYRRNLRVTSKTWNVWRLGLREHLGEDGLFGCHWGALRASFGDDPPDDQLADARFGLVRCVMKELDPAPRAPIRRWLRAL